MRPPSPPFGRRRTEQSQALLARPFKSEPAQGGEPAPVLFAVRLTGGLRRHRGAKRNLFERARCRREVEMNRKAALKRRRLGPAEEAPRPSRRQLREPRRVESPESGRGMEGRIHRLRISKATGRDHVCPVHSQPVKKRLRQNPLNRKMNFSFIDKIRRVFL